MKQFKNFKSICVFVAVVAMTFCQFTIQAQDVTALGQGGGLEVIPGQYIVKMKSTAADLSISAETATVRPTDDDGPDPKVKQTRIATLGKVQKLQAFGQRRTNSECRAMRATARSGTQTQRLTQLCVGNNQVSAVAAHRY